jgi:DNA-binding transcriptional ArsR family regulator
VTYPKLSWDCGPAYDFFASLNVLHEPESVGLRPAWAAGVRSRFPEKWRSTLDDIRLTSSVPVLWLSEFDEPKTAAAVLRQLAHVPPAERLWTLTFKGMADNEFSDILLKISEQGRWTEQDLQAMKTLINSKGKLNWWHKHKKEIPRLFEVWAKPEAFGDRLLPALQSYYDVFFKEEEARLEPALKQALQEAQTLAETLDAPALLEKLTRGIRLTQLPEVEELLLIPSFWFTPLIVSVDMTATRHAFMFAGRPADMSLVPGEVVPDALFTALKALADPTRLRILHYLSHDSLTPTELDTRLRLRPPTVVHHLQALRLAGLIQINLTDWEARSYQTRPEAIAQTWASLEKFLGHTIPLPSNPLPASTEAFHSATDLPLKL